MRDIKNVMKSILILIKRSEILYFINDLRGRPFDTFLRQIFAELIFFDVIYIDYFYSRILLRKQEPQNILRKNEIPIKNEKYEKEKKLEK